jgi:hypothetical protein
MTNLKVVVCSFVLFLLAIVLSVLLRFTDSDYPFGIFKLFLLMIVCLVAVLLQVIWLLFNVKCSGRVSSSCSTSGTNRVNLVTNPIISRE